MKNELIFRKLEYTNNEIGQIVSLIRRNLDPEFTEDFFRWKHLDNPFGKSYGLLALDGEKIIGLRMFMFWEFNTVKGYIKAIRPVDTVTDEKYRGKGIFKKLTLDGLQNILGEYDIVFNTPNMNSLPGYLKMGWRKLENLNCFRIALINPLLKSSDFSILTIDQLNIGEETSASGTTQTNKFLKWRYNDPMYQIAYFSSEGNYVIYRKSKINKVPSLIIYEIIGETSKHWIILNSLAKKYKTPFVYYYGGDIKNGQFLRSFKRKSPVVVIKNDIYFIGEKLNFSLGDLEGKL